MGKKINQLNNGGALRSTILVPGYDPDSNTTSYFIMPLQSPLVFSIYDLTALNNNPEMLIPAQNYTMNFVDFILKSAVYPAGLTALNIGTESDPAGLFSIPEYALNSTESIDSFTEGVAKGDLFNTDISNQAILMTLNGVATAGQFNFTLEFNL